MEYRVRYRAADRDYIVEWRREDDASCSTGKILVYSWEPIRLEADPTFDTGFSTLKNAINYCNEVMKGDKIYLAPCYQEEDLT